MVAIIDYDAGNIKSVENAVRFLGHDVKVTSDPSEILAADHIILPGVGAFFEESEESPGVKGLALLPGKIKRIPEGEGRKVPQIGWNDLSFPRQSLLFAGIPEGSYVYFVHSYYLEAGCPEDVAARTEYGVLIDAAVEHGRLFACQFHPEKSERIGMQILQNFLNIS